MYKQHISNNIVPSDLKQLYILNIHILILDEDISKKALLQMLLDVSNSRVIHLYLYGYESSKWLISLRELLDSVLVDCSNISVVLDNNNTIDITSRYINMYSNSIYINTSTNIKESLSLCVLNTHNDRPLILDRDEILCLDSSTVNMDVLSTIIYSNHNIYTPMRSKLIPQLYTTTTLVKPSLKLYIIYVDQLDLVDVGNIDVVKVVSRNKSILYSFNDILETKIINCPIDTSYIDIEQIIKNNTKDKPSSTILIVLDRYDRSNSVNHNNYSYYIPIDLFITPSVINNIFDIIIKNIYK